MVSNFEPVLSKPNEGMDGICSNPVDALLSNFFRREEEENKEVHEAEEMIVEWMRKMITKMDNRHQNRQCVQK